MKACIFIVQSLLFIGALICSMTIVSAIGLTLVTLILAHWVDTFHSGYHITPAMYDTYLTHILTFGFGIGGAFLLFWLITISTAILLVKVYQPLNKAWPKS